MVEVPPNENLFPIYQIFWNVIYSILYIVVTCIKGLIEIEFKLSNEFSGLTLLLLKTM